MFVTEGEVTWVKSTGFTLRECGWLLIYHHSNKDPPLAHNKVDPVSFFFLTIKQQFCHCKHASFSFVFTTLPPLCSTLRAAAVNVNLPSSYAGGAGHWPVVTAFFCSSQVWMQRNCIAQHEHVHSYVNEGSWIVKYSRTLNQSSSVVSSPSLVWGCWYVLWFPAHEGMSDGAVMKLNVIAKSLTWNQRDHWAISSLSRQTVLQINSVYVSIGSLQTVTFIFPAWLRLSGFQHVRHWQIIIQGENTFHVIVCKLQVAMWQTNQWYIFPISLYFMDTFCVSVNMWQTVFVHICGYVSGFFRIRFFYFGLSVRFFPAYNEVDRICYQMNRHNVNFVYFNFEITALNCAQRCLLSAQSHSQVAVRRLD